MLYAHAVVAAPRLALGWLRALGPLLCNPRLGIIGIFLSLSRILPDRYPLRREANNYLGADHGFGQMLDHGVIVLRLQQLYEWSAAELGDPHLLSYIRDCAPYYAWSFEDREVWHVGETSFATRTLKRLMPPSSRAR